MSTGEHYPIMLRLQDLPCVVVGAGHVGQRKVAGLLAAGARVTVISPTLEGELFRQWAAENVITVRLSLYRPGMLAELHPRLVFAATNDPTVNQQVAAEARALGALVDVVDNRAASDFMSMPAFQRGPITVAISTGGVSPALAAHLREKLEAVIGGEYGLLAAWLADQRETIKSTVTVPTDRRDLWRAVLAAPVLELLRQGDVDAARDLFDQLVATASHP